MSRRGPRQIQLEVQSLSEDGLGEGAYDSRIVRARNALPGETVDVQVLKRRGGIWLGQAELQDGRSPQRQVPPCAVFPRCGGCALQHLDYPAQLEHKSRQLLTLLEAHGVVPRRVRPPTTAVQLHYRHKARLGVRLVGDELLAGFREGFSNRVVRMSECMTLAQPFARMLPELQRTLSQLRCPGQIPQVELSAGDREFSVIVRHLTPFDDHDLELLRFFSRRSGIRVLLQPGGYDTVHELDAANMSHLSYANPDFGLSFEFLPTDFTQVNPYINRALVRAALLALAPRPDATATDMFCGIGNFSLALARLGVRVRGYESAPGAVQRARHNAGRNGLSGRAEFAVADLYDANCQALPESRYLLLDPPRSGAGPNLAAWARWSALERIAYVSCNPRTFAVDAAVLKAHGFTLEEAGIFDMFPHTAHVETLGLFVRQRPAPTHG